MTAPLGGLEGIGSPVLAWAAVVAVSIGLMANRLAFLPMLMGLLVALPRQLFYDVPEQWQPRREKLSWTAWTAALVLALPVKALAAPLASVAVQRATGSEGALQLVGLLLLVDGLVVLAARWAILSAAPPWSEHGPTLRPRGAIDSALLAAGLVQVVAVALLLAARATGLQA